MFIKKIADVPKIKIDDNATKNVTRQIPIGIEDGSDKIIMRVFTVKPGGHSPLHTHDFEHLVKVEKGRAIAVDKDGEHEIKEGDYVFVKPNEIHQFKNTFEEDFQFICVIPNK